jgi:hypothetical protein
MSYLWEAELAQEVYEAAVFYDDGDNPVAQEGPSSYKRSEWAAEAFARATLRGRRSERPGGFWYATIRRGKVVDPIGEGQVYDRDFEPDPNWSRTLLADEHEESR